MLLKSSQKNFIFWLFSILFLLCFNNAWSQNVSQNFAIKNNQNQPQQNEENKDFDDFSDLGVLKDIVEDDELPIDKPQIIEEDDKLFLNPDIFDPQKNEHCLQNQLLLTKILSLKIFATELLPICLLLIIIIAKTSTINLPIPMPIFV